jgi:hypothetical protein
MPPVPVKPARQGGTVRLTLSAKVANDLGALERSLKSLAERLGHPQCATGCDMLFIQMERDFTIGADVALNPQPLPPQELFAMEQTAVPSHAVQVMIPDRVNNNVRSIHKALATTLGKLGCPACCSGFDILFRRELDLIAFDDKVAARGFGRYR